jgi:hypothetical protein
MRTQSNFIRFIKAGKEVAECLPAYSNKFSNHVYTQHQHTILLVLKQKLKLTYRSIIDLLKSNPLLCKLLKLRRIPHYTTLQKFFRRISGILLDKLLIVCNKRSKTRIAIDVTGFYPVNASSYYCLRYLKPSSLRKYVKLSIAIDTSKQVILAQRIRKAPAHDNLDFMPLLKRVIMLRRVSCVVADKAYDAEINHRFVVQNLKAKSVIATRNSFNSHCQNTMRKRVARNFDMHLYHQRSKVESVFSAIKRKYGSILYSRSFALQKKELICICKCLAYNLDRKIILFCIGFLQTRNIK